MPHAFVYECNAFPMGHYLTSGDLVLGHSDLVVEHFETPAKDNYKPYRTVQILLKVKISAHFQI